MLNSNKLGQRKNVNLPGVHVDIPVLTKKDINDLQVFPGCLISGMQLTYATSSNLMSQSGYRSQEFCCKNRMDYVAASFVQTANDVRYEIIL